MKRKIESALKTALQYILMEREKEYREAWSVLFWGLRADYRISRHCFSPVTGEVFCRALILDLFIDLYESGFVVESVVNEDLDILLSKKGRKGWKYYPDHDLPEDADDTGLILESLVRMGHDKSRCSDIAGFLAENIMEDGAIFTWLVDPEERERAEKLFGGGVSPAVTATAAYSLYLADSKKYRSKLEKTSAWIQHVVVSGNIEPVWYVSPLYALYRMVRFLDLYDSLSDSLKEKSISLNGFDSGSLLDLSYTLLIQNVVDVDVHENYVCRLLELQKTNGSFGRENFHYYLPPTTPRLNFNVLKNYRPDVVFYSSAIITAVIASKALSQIYAMI